jgi:parallel beta-helix repeat protein
MPVTSKLFCAGLSDTGRARRQNEDRIHVDPERGIFIVADGLGGHAAGERAAETAIQMIVARLLRHTGTTEERIREAIAVANNEIHALAANNPEWSGMASVVTLALIEDDQVVVGHVGDSRLYLLEPGAIRKITHDHSPVGELEDSGRLSEAAAMAHPRRNEVFRDLGSEVHSPDDPDFVEISRFRLRPDAAILLCSDGLSDLVPSDQIRRIVETHARKPDLAAAALVKAANDAGGKDNISVILVEGPEYGAAPPPPVVVPAPPARRIPLFIAFIAGFLLAALLFLIVRPYRADTGMALEWRRGIVRGPLVWKVGPGHLATISEALQLAAPGDTITVAPGVYRESVRLKPAITLLSAQRHRAVIESPDVALEADGVTGARVSGFRIGGAGRIGIRIVDSRIEISDVEVTGMSEAGIEIAAGSPALIVGSTIRDNPGAGIVIHGAARPVLSNNIILGNGRTPHQLRPGLHIAGSAQPSLTGNVVSQNGAEQVWISPLFDASGLLASNVIAPGLKERDLKRQIKVVTR